jgi:hypothetical protein
MGYDTDDAVLQAPGVSSGVRSYVKGLLGEAEPYVEQFLGLLNAGVNNVKKLDASGIWRHNDNAAINAADPTGNRDRYMVNGRFDHDAVERDIAKIKAELSKLDRERGQWPDMDPSVAGRTASAKSAQVARTKEALTQQLQQLQKHKQWACGLCREWAQSNYEAIVQCRPTLYTVEWLELMGRVLGMDVTEHNVVRIAEKSNQTQAFVFDSWKAPTTIAPWPEFFKGYRLVRVTRQYRP